MGNITNSFVKQQIQSLNQLKTQSTATIEKTPLAPSIGQTEFQARKALFEKQTSREPQLGEETREQLGSGLNQISGEKLQKHFQLFEKTFKVIQPQEEEECQQEVSDTEESHAVTLKQAPQSLSQEEEEGEAEMAISVQPLQRPQHPHVEEIDHEEEQTDGQEEPKLEQNEQSNRPSHANHPPSSPPVLHSGNENPLNVPVNQPKPSQQSGADNGEADEDEF